MRLSHLCREAQGSFLRHPFSTRLRNQMTQPLSLAHPGLRRQTTPQRTHSCSLVVSGPGAFFHPVPMPEELRGKMSEAGGSQLYQLSIPARSGASAGVLSTAEPPTSLVLRSGGSTLRCSVSPRRASSSHPGSPGDSQESCKQDSPRQRLEAAGKIYIITWAGGQSRELPRRPRSHHPAHSCSRPFGNQTLLEEIKKI